MKTKGLDYYMGLDYTIILRKHRDTDSPYFEATARELDSNAFYGVGQTASQAVAELEAVKTELFADYLQNGIPIPEPRPHLEDLPSGNFVVRTAPMVHRKLIDLARENSLSLNATVNKILDEYVTTSELTERFAGKMHAMVCAASPRIKTSYSRTGWATTANYHEEEYKAVDPKKVTDLTPYSDRDKRKIASL